MSMSKGGCNASACTAVLAGPAGDGLRGPGGPRDGPGSRSSVFDRLYSAGRPHSAPAAAADRDRDRDRQRDRELERTHSRDRDRHTDRDADSLRAAAAGSGSRPPITSRLSSRVVAAAAAAGDDENRPEQQRNGVLSRLSSGDPRDKQQQHDDAEQQQQQQPSGGSRKRLLSAVLINGQARSLSASLDDVAVAEAAAPVEPPPKRPAVAVDEGTKKRTRRLFGALLQGTLKKAK